MKKTEVAMIVLIASFAMMGAFFLTQTLFGSEIEREAIVETTEPISVNSKGQLSVSGRIFNEKALNPTVEVYVIDVEGGEETIEVEGDDGGEG